MTAAHQSAKELVMTRIDFTKLNRRELFQLSLMTASATLIGQRTASGLVACNALPPQPYPIDIQTGLSVIEAFPTSPFILNPFNDPLPIPTALRPGWQRTDDTLISPSATDAWQVRQQLSGEPGNVCKPAPEAGHQDCMGARRRSAGASGVIV